MKRTLLPLLILAASTMGIAQNLVVNPSFELTNTNCGALGGEGFRQDLDPDWDNASSNIPGDSCSSPDLFSACNVIFGINSPTFMPNSVLGYQYSRTGTRHAGIIVHEALDEYREYIQGHTTVPLTAGQVYCVSMYVSLGNSVAYATDNIGVRFSNTHYLRDPCGSTNNSPIYLTPQLNYDCGPITDTTNWVRLQWSYTATGGEQYFMIGNFFNNANTTIVSNPGGSFINPYAYYYIDDVSISATPCCTADLSAPNTVCVTDPAYNLTALTGNVNSCVNTATGTWSGTGITNAANGTFNPATAGPGTHTLTFTMPCGFTGSTTVTVNACSALSVCINTNGDLTVSGGAGPYSWQSQSTSLDCSGCFLGQCIPPICNGTTVTTWTTFSSNATATPPGTFPIRVIDQTGGEVVLNSAAGLPSCVACAMTSSIAAQTAVSCLGGSNGSATVSAAGATGTPTFTWNPGNLTGATQTALSAGAYTVTVASGACTSTTTVTITQPASLPSAVISEVVAPGCAQSNGSITVNASGGTAGYTYSWAPSGGNQATASGLAAGNYTATVTDANGCPTTVTQQLSTANSPTLSLGSSTDVTCFGASNGAATVSASGGNPGYSYLWSNGQTTASASGLAPGDAVCTVTDQAGCAANITVSIAEPVILNSTATSGNTPCGQNSGTSTVTPTGGTAPYSYAWSTNPVQTGTTASGLGGGAYTVVVTDAHGCISSALASITNTGGPTVTVSSQQNVQCNGLATGSANLSVSGGGAPYSYAWQPGGQTSGGISGLTAGTYTYTVTNTLGCVTSSSLTITEPPALWPNATGQDVTCKGDANGVLTSAPSGGVGPYTYSWSNGPSTAGQTGIVSGNYTLTVTDANGCDHDTLIQVGFSVDFSVSATLSGNTFTATPATNYQWYLDGQPIPGATSQTYTMTESGNYYVVGTDSNGCEGTSTPIEATYIGIDEGVFGRLTVITDRAGEEVVVRGTRPMSTAVQWNLFDATGRKLSTGQVAKGLNEAHINMNQADNGAYTIRLSSKDGNSTVKVMWVR